MLSIAIGTMEYKCNVMQTRALDFKYNNYLCCPELINT